MVWITQMSSWDTSQTSNKFNKIWLKRLNARISKVERLN